MHRKHLEARAISTREIFAHWQTFVLCKAPAALMWRVTWRMGLDSGYRRSQNRALFQYHRLVCMVWRFHLQCGTQWQASTRLAFVVVKAIVIYIYAWLKHVAIILPACLAHEDIAGCHEASASKNEFRICPQMYSFLSGRGIRYIVRCARSLLRNLES